MSFRVYIAASASPSEALRVQAATAALKAAGFIVTSTWPEVVAKVGSANPRDAGDLNRRCWAIQDLSEIDDSDAIWFLTPEPPLTTRGGWCELMHAHDENKHVVSSGDTRQSIFTALGREFETDGGALAHLHQLRVERSLAELATSAPAALVPEFDLGDLGGEGG